MRAPRSVRGAAWREVLRRHPRAELRTYRGDPPPRSRGDALVFLCTTTPRRGPRGGSPAGLALHDRRAVLVFVLELRAALRARRGDPRLAVAVGRTLAHELEHLRRGSQAHDRAGWFRPWVDLTDL